MVLALHTWFALAGGRGWSRRRVIAEGLAQTPSTAECLKTQDRNEARR
jgi:hypothetical protein